MKSKATNIALIVALAGIWGTIIYKFIGGSADDDNYYLPQSKNTTPAEEIKLIEENFELNGEYRDPFLGKVHHQQHSSHGNKTVKKTAKQPFPKVISPPADWSFLVYRGDFINEKKQHIGIVTIRNQDFLAREGEEKKGIKILKILKDSIQVNYQNEKKYIPKAKK